MKQILIIAGPNGAGKTTFATEFLPNEAGVPIFVNADIIAAETSAGEVAAGREMLKQLDAHARRGDSFAFETTLSGRAYIERIRRWREDGYHVTLFFLVLPHSQVAVERVALRVRQGGHPIPEETIRRRFDAGRVNFYQVYRHLVDAWYVYDMVGREPIELEAHEQAKVETEEN